MSEKSYRYILYEKNGHISKIVFNNPERRNAMSAQMLSELYECLLDSQTDKEIMVIILTGAGDKAFSSGQDFALPFEGAGTSTGTYNYLRNVCYESHRLMERMEKPIIAAVNGFCYAGGMEYALACDFIIASDNAMFGITEVGLGILPGSGGIVRYARSMPVRKAKELLLTAARLTAQEAYEIGLVNKVVPFSKLEETVMAIAEKIASQSPFAVRMAKMVFNSCLEISDIDAALALERSACSMVAGTEDAMEGPIAFMEKRPPVWKGK
jgi:enoyl-CoA hydratase/carnithine racemase